MYDRILELFILKESTENMKRLKSFILAIILLTNHNIYKPIEVCGDGFTEEMDIVESDSELDFESLEERFDVSVEVTAKWNHHYNANIIIKNISDEKIENWELSFIMDGKMENIWNAKMIQHKGDSYIVKNNIWNQDIFPGSSVEFGMTVYYEGEFEIPSDFTMDKVCKKVEKQYEIEKIIYSQWDTGVTGVVRIHNKSDEVIEDWKITLKTNVSFESIWNAKKEYSDGDLYYFDNCNYNSNIAPNSYVDVGFRANYNNTFYLDEIELYNIETYMEDTTDSDQDGLYDYLEKNIYFTDAHCSDSDQDGITDFYEIMILLTNPLNKDDNDDGIVDGDEDFDEDGLINSEEEKKETNPYNGDTDFDGLNDYDEIYIYNTNPLNEDTDDDGISDEFEIDNGLDALDSNSNNCVDNSSWIMQNYKEEFNEDIVQYIEVGFNSPDEIEDHVNISDDNENVYMIENDVLSEMHINVKLMDDVIKDDIVVLQKTEEGWEKIGFEISDNLISFNTSSTGIYKFLVENNYVSNVNSKSFFKASGVNLKSGKKKSEKKLRDELEKQVKKDFGKTKTIVKGFLGHTSDEAIDIILKYDKYIDNLSKGYNVNKALIQALLFRELICYDSADIIADNAVIEYFAHKEKMEKFMKAKWWKQLIMGVPAPNGPIKPDCSTGLGQIFARTAIDSINFGLKNKNIKLDADNWKVRKQIWYSLHDDDEYNIKTITKILVKEADGIKNVNLKSPKNNHAKLLLARYNLSGRKKAGNYGKACFRYYKKFMKYNNGE